MSLSKLAATAALVAAVAATPLLAQTQTTTAQTTKTTTTTTTATKARTHGSSGTVARNTPAAQRVWQDSTRLASMLRDVQYKGDLPAATWRTIATEASSLANRIYGNTASNRQARAAARDLRTHVRAMRTAAMSGDAAGARDHANQALPFVYTLIDWAQPAKS